MMSALIIPLLLAQMPPPELDAIQFARLLGALHSDIHDFELVCEGKIRFIDDSDPRKDEKRLRLDRAYQTSYAYRGDGSTYQDLYELPLRPGGQLLHRTSVLFAGRLSEIVQSPDKKETWDLVQTDNSGPGSIHPAGSPERFIYYWYWKRFIQDPRIWDLEFKGWEEVGGQRCLRVDVNEVPGTATAGNSLSRFWIDMDRGGHALKREFVHDNQIWLRVHNVELGRIPSPGGKLIWFPLHGEFDSFVNGSRFGGTPVLHETYDVVKGSLALNEGLPDNRFSLKWRGPKAETAAFKEARQQFSKAPAKPAPPPLRTDPAGVQKYQEEKLAEADRQAIQLDASPPSRQPWNATTMAQMCLAVLGIASLIAALILRRRP